MFTNNMRRPFVVRYNAYTESVEASSEGGGERGRSLQVLNNKRSLMLAVNALRSDSNLIARALHYIL